MFFYKDLLLETTGIDTKEIVESNASYGRNQLTSSDKEPTLPHDEVETSIEEPVETENDHS